MKDKLLEPLNDWKHWLGWVISAGVLTLFLHLNNIHIFHTSNYIPNFKFLTMTVVIAVVDWAKHKVMLQ